MQHGLYVTSGTVGEAMAPRRGRQAGSVAPLADARKPVSVLRSPSDQSHANVSPDGRFIGYSPSESGEFEVYVQTFPRFDRRWPISTSGGDEPCWRADGREM